MNNSEIRYCRILCTADPPSGFRLTGRIFKIQGFFFYYKLQFALIKVQNKQLHVFWASYQKPDFVT